MSAETKVVAVTVPLDRVKLLKEEADKQGLSLPTYCRTILSKAADQLKQAA